MHVVPYRSYLYQLNLSVSDQSIGYIHLKPCVYALVYNGSVSMTKPFWNFEIQNPTQICLKSESNIVFRING